MTSQCSLISHSSLPFRPLTFRSRAIALSLKESQAERNDVRSEARNNNDQREALEDDQEARFQEELRRAIEASANESHPSTSRVPPLHTQTSARGQNETQPGAGSSSAASPFLSERAELERARLERQKRLRSVDDDGDDDSRGGAGSSGYAGAPSRKRQHTTTSSQSSSREESLRSSSAASTSTAAATSTSSARGKAKAEEGLFWDGEIRQTANKHVERGKNGEDGNPVWRLSEIIGDVCLPSRSHFLSLSRLPDVSDPSPIRRDVHTIEI